jgi:RND family efflux transporter MFP subunit
MRLAPAFIALALAACGAREPAPAGAPPRTVLETGVVEMREVDLAYSAEAVVEAVRQSTVSSQISGRIVDVRFDVGDRVKKGDVIVRIDETAASQALAASQAQAGGAQAALANARANVERSRSLMAQGFISQAALDKAEADYRAAEAQVKATLAGAGQAATERSFATVVAPYTGVVSARHVQLGELATPGRPLMTGFDPAGLRVVATVPSTQVAAIQSTGRARVEIPSRDRWIEARAVTVLPSADPRTHATQVRVELPNDVEGIYPGIFARAHCVTGAAPRLMVPRAAVLRRSELTAVYVVDASGHPSLRQVRLGTAADQRAVEVLAGVKPGERVALDPSRAASLAS